MDVSMDGLVHPVRENDVRKYVLVYSSRVLVGRTACQFSLRACVLHAECAWCIA
jgi:hypothetical protein